MLRTITIIVLGVMVCAIGGCKERQSAEAEKTTSLGGDTLMDRTIEVISPELKQDSLSYRDRNWQPERGQYYFSESYHFKYYNEAIPSEGGTTSKEFGFYVDPESGTLLLEKYLTNYFDEMTDYVIVQPDGTYILGYTDEFGTKKAIRKNLKEVEGLSEKIEYGTEDFKTYFQMTDESKTFGANPYYPKKLNGDRYLRRFPFAQDSATLFLSDTHLPTKALYLVGEIFSELGMPLRQDYGFVLPEGTLVTQERYQTPDGKRIGFQLTSIMATEYHLKVPD
ncbi:hypothetical protein ABV409_02950 [Flagellimonas sp. DF-77]|uniref:hypothetical protein n=1 Tax=Flagellimonas algarum TaxID=3230298 RepID=UPI00339511A1